MTQVECFHIPSISQLKDILQVPFFFPKDLTTKLKTGVRVLKKKCYLHYDHQLSTSYMPSIPPGMVPMQSQSCKEVLLSQFYNGGTVRVQRD